MMHGATEPKAGHDYDTGKPCTTVGCRGRTGLPFYHYSCKDCGADCSVGAPAGPGCTDTRGVVRCHQCAQAWSQERAALTPFSREELGALRVALSQIADDGDPLPITAAHRKMATELLCRHENRGR